MSACKAVLNIKGDLYLCDITAPHPGWSHANLDAQAYWCSDGESKRWAHKRPVDKSSTLCEKRAESSPVTFSPPRPITSFTCGYCGENWTDIEHRHFCLLGRERE